MYDAVIVGGGPAGSRVAFRLAQLGHNVLVLEAKKSTGKKCCTGIVGMECVRTFEIDKKVIIHQANNAMLYSPSENTIYLSRPEPQAAILDREAFDKSMVEKAQKAGAEYSFSSRVTGAETGQDRINIMVEERGKIPAKVIIVACGFMPGLIEKLGLGGFKDFTGGAQAEVEAPLIDRVEVYFGDMAPEFFSWIVPTYPNRVKVGLLARHEPWKHLQQILENLYKAGEIPHKEIEAVIHYGSIPLRPPTKTYGERMLAVGDAAGQVKPTSGGGIYYGLICADIAADTLHQALTENNFSALKLAQYEKAWRARLGKEIRNGYRARKLLERFSNKGLDSLFRLAQTWGVEQAIAKAPGVAFDWHSRTLKQVIKYRLSHIFGR